MSCKGICTRYRAQKPAASFSRYATGQKRCQKCAIFMRWDGLWCPCCGCKVRTKPHNSRLKQKSKATREKHYINKNKKQYSLLIYKKNDTNSNSSPFVN